VGGRGEKHRFGAPTGSVVVVGYVLCVTTACPSKPSKYYSTSTPVHDLFDRRVAFWNPPAPRAQPESAQPSSTTWFEYPVLQIVSRRIMHVVVIVLGDVGRSLVRQYHTLSLLHEGFDVSSGWIHWRRFDP
jgi:hypothetical protein